MEPHAAWRTPPWVTPPLGWGHPMDVSVASSLVNYFSSNSTTIALSLPRFVIVCEPVVPTHSMSPCLTDRCRKERPEKVILKGIMNAAPLLFHDAEALQDSLRVEMSAGAIPVLTARSAQASPRPPPGL